MSLFSATFCVGKRDLAVRNGPTEVGNKIQGDVLMRLATIALNIMVAGILLLPSMALATEEYDLTVTMPIIRAGGRAGLEQVTFRTYSSPLETRVGAVTWDPCKSKGKSLDCDMVNPIHAAGINVSLYAYNAEDEAHLDGCYIKIDLSGYKALSRELRAAFQTDKVKEALIRRLVESIGENTRDSRYYADCEWRLIGKEQHSDIQDIKLQKYLNPVIPECQPRTPERTRQARAYNDQGMEYYRAKQWKQAEESFRNAAQQDCEYFLARTNLASVLALQKQFEKARAVLWRAYQTDPEQTLKKLEEDPDYRLLKQDANFYSAASPIGLLYRNHCFAPADPSELNPKLQSLIGKSDLKKYAKPYRIAKRYVFEADFNRNGIADRAYPLVISRLESILIVFDGGKLGQGACTSTPLGRYGLARGLKDDPCRIFIGAGAQGSKRGIRLKTDYIDINRLVCR